MMNSGYPLPSLAGLKGSMGASMPAQGRGPGEAWLADRQPKRGSAAAPDRRVDAAMELVQSTRRALQVGPHQRDRPWGCLTLLFSYQEKSCTSHLSRMGQRSRE